MHLHHLAGEIERCIVETLQQSLDVDDSDEILKCGKAPLAIIEQRPNEVLQLAQNKLHTWPYRDVPACWRRLYEDASLWKVVAVLRSAIRDNIETVEIAKRSDERTRSVASGNKRRKIAPWKFAEKDSDDESARTGTEWIGQITHILDMATAMSGAPKRAQLLTLIFEMIYENIKMDDVDAPSEFHIDEPSPFDLVNAVNRTSAPLSFEAFQSYITSKAKPLIMPDAVIDWLAYERWRSPRYLMQTTLNGRRLVPVEVGSSYTDEAWGQRVLPFSEYLHTYLLNPTPPDVGYLAQYDLFAQIPRLRNDILTPEYCFTSPSAPHHPPRNASEVKALEIEPLDEPLVNAWLGPRGTKSPMHTDPYHNILCQVVGSKYIRLFSPEETDKLYPRGIDEAGVDMSNTSQIEVDRVKRLYDRSQLSNDGSEVNCEEALSDLADFERCFPKFTEAKYQECILGPGECLYIPLGWWHYVESLSTSFSVSFWWN